MEESLPDRFIFMKQVGDKHIPVAHGHVCQKCLDVGIGIKC